MKVQYQYKFIYFEPGDTHFSKVENYNGSTMLEALSDFLDIHKVDPAQIIKEGVVKDKEKKSTSNYTFL